jgi:ureidoglycolate hydrolase
METSGAGPQISAQEAAASLAVVKDGITWENGFWHAPVAPLATAAAAFAVWAGSGIAATTFSARR